MLKLWREQMFPMFFEADDDQGGDPPKVETPEEETPKEKSAVQIRIDKLTGTIGDLREQVAATLKEKKEAGDQKLADEKKFKDLYEQGKTRIFELEADLEKATAFQTAEYKKQQERWTKIKAGIPEDKHELFDMATDDDEAVAGNLAEYDKMVRLKVLTGPGSTETDTTVRTTTTPDEVDEYNPLSAQIEKEAEQLE